MVNLFRKKIIFFIAAFFCFSFFATANIRLPAIISSNMVLQQKSTAKLWGWCEPEEKLYITTSWNNQTDSIRGSRDARWQISVATPAAGGPFTITLKAGNTILLENIMIGEVWVCSGQSNMEMSESWGLPDVRSELATCATNTIHFFRIPRTTSASPQDDCVGHWAPCDSTQLKRFSAVGYFFAKKLSRDLNVPVGIIEAAWGGTSAETWTPPDLVNNDAELKSSAAKQKPSDGWPYTPGVCYNGMIAPITSYEIAGAIWYQGEGNTAAPQTYGRLFRTMIGAWRKAWNKNLPFYYVQIAPFTYGAKGNSGTLIREQQEKSMSLDNTGMVVISDLVEDTTDIHPKNKHEVGARLADWALGEAYHATGISYKSPSYRSIEVRNNKVWVHFADATTGLVVKGPHIREIFIAGEDKIFYPAEATVEGNELIVSSRQVKKPTAVRYQFSNAGIGNVFSKEGLPLAPFRSDDWSVSAE
ncbi:MAG TPA: sialate O-acetylesterase [Puia sp.]|nr:sialate O-acetylesterase [Puia sp.]